MMFLIEVSSVRQSNFLFIFTSYVSLSCFISSSFLIAVSLQRSEDEAAAAASGDHVDTNNPGGYPPTSEGLEQLYHVESVDLPPASGEAPLTTE